MLMRWKRFVTVFFALISAPVMILSGFLAKSRIDVWEQSWRDCEDQMSIFRDSELAYSRALQYRASFGSPEMALRDAKISLHRLEDAQVQITQIQHAMVAILEHKPFGLPLTDAERGELESAKESLRKHVRKPR